MPAGILDLSCLASQQPVLAVGKLLPAEKQEAEAAPKTGSKTVASKDTVKKAAEQSRSVQQAYFLQELLALQLQDHEFLIDLCMH